MKRNAQDQLFSEFKALDKNRRIHRFACQIGRLILKAKKRHELTDVEVALGIELLRKNHDSPDVM